MPDNNDFLSHIHAAPQRCTDGVSKKHTLQLSWYTKISSMQLVVQLEVVMEGLAQV